MKIMIFFVAVGICVHQIFGVVGGDSGQLTVAKSFSASSVCSTTLSVLKNVGRDSVS